MKQKMIYLDEKISEKEIIKEIVLRSPTMYYVLGGSTPLESDRKPSPSQSP